MNDQHLDEFEQWLKDELKMLEPQDNGFSQEVLAKVNVAPSQASSILFIAEQFDRASWIFCAGAIGTLLLQSLMQIDAEVFSGPILESMLLLMAMMVVCWQCQESWVRD